MPPTKRTLVASFMKSREILITFEEIDELLELISQADTAPFVKTELTTAQARQTWEDEPTREISKDAVERLRKAAA